VFNVFIGKRVAIAEEHNRLAATQEKLVALLGYSRHGCKQPKKAKKEQDSTASNSHTQNVAHSGKQESAESASSADVWPKGPQLDLKRKTEITDGHHRTDDFWSLDISSGRGRQRIRNP